MIRATLASLHVYPVKSCRGIELAHAVVDVRGLQHDREWMIVDATGRFITQREHPEMARIATGFESGELVLSVEQHGEIRLPLAVHDGERVEVCCWRFVTDAIDCGLPAARWLSERLGEAVRLVRFPPDVQRLCNSQWAGQSGAHTLFADGYPFLVLGQESVADLAQRMGITGRLPIDRFRPNLVIRGLAAYEEDYVDTLEFGALQLKLVKPCARCTIPAVDQRTGVVTPHSPLDALQAYRMDPTVGGATLGINAILERGAGEMLYPGAHAQAVHRFDASPA
jgi:uncharacterized protein